MDSDYGRISRVAFKAGISVLFTAAMLANIGRIIIRLCYQKRLFADDYILLFGCSSLIAAFTLTTLMFEDIYFHMSINLGPLEYMMQEFAAPDFKNRMLNYQKLSFSNSVLCWVTIFAVKMSYLLFFRQMVGPLKTVRTYWMVTVGIVVLSGLLCICSIFIACPGFGDAASECAHGSGLMRMIIISQAANALNMLTDLLIIAVPIVLLWKVKIRPHQKMILASFLCLSVCMFSICLVRAIGETIESNEGTSVDIQWNVFWHNTEASVAVMVVSLTAFRSLYSFKTSEQQKNRNRREPGLYAFGKNLLSRRKQRRVDEFGDTIMDEPYSLPSIPGATLTGMRTMIGGKRATLTSMSTLIGAKSAMATQPQSTREDSLSVDEAWE